MKQTQNLQRGDFLKTAAIGRINDSIGFVETNLGQMVACTIIAG